MRRTIDRAALAVISLAILGACTATKLETKAARNVATVLRGEVPATTLNPEVVDADVYRLGRRLAAG